MLQINPASFYGKKIVCVRALPAESEDGELKSKNEDEQSAFTAVQNRGHESNSDSDSGSVNELFVRHLEGKAASKKITWKSAQPEKVKSPDITFSGAQYEPEEVKFPIEYFHDVFDKELVKYLLMNQTYNLFSPIGLRVRNFSRHSGNKESHAWEL